MGVFRRALSIGLAVFGAATAWQPLIAQTQQAKPAAGMPELKIVVLDGDNGINIIKKKTAVKPVVEVRDRNGLPVAGASVAFVLPGMGPSATFAHGAKVLTVITDASGRAAAGAMQPVGEGTFKISVTASFRGQSATTSISQTNYLTVAAANAATGGAAGAAGGVAGAGAGAGISGAVIGVIVAGVAAAAVGAAVALKGGGSSSGTSATRPSATIGAPGGPVFSAPH